MSQIINWLREPSTDFAYIILDFGTEFQVLEKEYPKNIDDFEGYVNNYATGTPHLVPLNKKVTLEKLKEVIQKRYLTDSSEYAPYVWKPLGGLKIDVLVDKDGDGRAMVFQDVRDTPFAPGVSEDMENTCANLGSTYVEAYHSLQKK